MAIDWPALEPELRRRWSAGERAAAIGAALGGISKNAVIGKARRLGLEKRAPTRPRMRRHYSQELLHAR